MVGVSRLRLTPTTPPVIVPFRASFRDAIREGRKTATTRTTRYGWPGDKLTTSFGISIVLTDVYQQTLTWVAHHLWQEEAVESPEAFVAVWRSLHRGSWDDHRMVWVHRFKTVYP